MLVSINWIKEFVDLDKCKMSIEELINKFTLSAAEVESIIYKGKDIEKVVSGKIISLEKHPNSKKLHLLKVDTGDKLYNCVCGAPDVELNRIVAFAMAGGSVVAGKINKTTVAGYESEGMCCGESELGISDDDTGLMWLPEDTELGVDIKKLYPQIDDIIFEIDNKSLTNRPDLWGHYGIAREFAAISGQKLRKLNLQIDYPKNLPEIDVEVVRKDLVCRYSCIKIGNLTKNISPIGMRIRLFYCGMRALNLMADLTNYVMLELGQPMHAFDAQDINKISLDMPKSPFKFTTLDGVERNINENLLIYNEDEKNKKPMAIAGVIGGQNSEIVDDTKQVILESANFDATHIRKSSSALSLRTDASTRFEKTLDPELTVQAINRFIELLKEIDDKIEIKSNLTDLYVKKYPVISLVLEQSYIDRYTGINIDQKTVCKILESLEFEVSYNNGIYKISVPSWRATKDVTIKADIIEEISRIYGYDNFDSIPTLGILNPVELDVSKREENQIKNILVEKFGLHEIHSYIWCDEKKYREIGIDVDQNIEITNTTSPDNRMIRNSLIPNLLVSLYENRFFSKSFGIFEIARVVEGLNNKNLCNERRKVGIILFDKESSEKDLYFKAIGILRYIFSKLKHDKIDFGKINLVKDWQHPKNSLNVIYDGNECGVINTLHPNTVSKIDKNSAIVCLELDLDLISKGNHLDLNYIEPSKFPNIDIDLCLCLGNSKISYKDIEKTWNSLNIEELTDVKLLDTYCMDNMNSITVRLCFSSQEKTLSMEEIKPKVDKILENLSEMGINIRI